MQWGLSVMGQALLCSGFSEKDVPWARRRKGMSSDVSINAYFDDELLLQLARQDADLLGFM